MLFSSGFSWLSVPLVAQDSTRTANVLREIASSVMRNTSFEFIDSSSGHRFPSPVDAPSGVQLQLASPYTDWRYWNGVLSIALLRAGDALDERSYSEFPHRTIAFAFDHYRYFQEKYSGQAKWDYPFGQRFVTEELDDYGAMGSALIEVYARDHQERYKRYIDQAAAYILTRQGRLEDGTFVRSFPQEWTLWADDLYMSVCFLSRMGEFTGDKRFFDDAARQVINFHKYLFNEQTGLMYHCWYSASDQQGVAFWGRANGWAMMAQLDLLDRLPANHPQRDTLLTLLRKHVLGLARYQGADGLWHQLLDKRDSYQETSCSAMITYSVARAVDGGYIEPRYASIAQRGWEGLLSKIHTDGTIEGVCAGTVVSDDLVYYYQRPTPPNDIHGIGAVLLAGVEILHLQNHLKRTGE